MVLTYTHRFILVSPSLLCRRSRQKYICTSSFTVSFYHCWLVKNLMQSDWQSDDRLCGIVTDKCVWPRGRERETPLNYYFDCTSTILYSNFTANYFSHCLEFLYPPQLYPIILFINLPEASRWIFLLHPYIWVYLWKYWKIKLYYAQSLNSFFFFD